MTDDNTSGNIEKLVQVLELSKKAGIEEVPMKIDVLLEMVDEVKSLEGEISKKIQKAKHSGWLVGVADMARIAATGEISMPKSPFKGEADD